MTGPHLARPPEVPAPPPGPGVSPPFPAPPTEGRTIRLWLGLGVAGLAVLLCCGGGLAAVLGLAVTGTAALEEQAHTAVRDYVGALQKEEYAKAYGMLCERARRAEPESAFVNRVAAEPGIVDYQLGGLQFSPRLAVPAQVTYAGGGSASVRFILEQDQRTGELKVCGIAR